MMQCAFPSIKDSRLPAPEPRRGEFLPGRVVGSLNGIRYILTIQCS